MDDGGFDTGIHILFLLFAVCREARDNVVGGEIEIYTYMPRRES